MDDKITKKQQTQLHWENHKMSPYEYAMKMEKEGQKYFEDNAAKMESPQLKSIFEELAADEGRHWKVFKAMSEGETPDIAGEFKSNLIPTAQNIFKEMNDAEQEIADFPDDVKQCWERARDIEDKAEEFYRDCARKADSDAERAIWNQIASEEHRHWVALNNVIDFIDHPNQWLADAEWSKMTD